MTKITATIVLYLLFFKHLCFTKYFHCIHMARIFLLNKPHLNIVREMPRVRDVKLMVSCVIGNHI